MPLYEYQCSKCGNVFEVIQKFSDTPLKKHQGCGGKVEKLISAPSFQFKGTGWYATDYPKSNAGAKTEGKDEGKSESKTDAKSEGKSETKSDSKTETESKSEAKKESKPAPASKGD